MHDQPEGFQSLEGRAAVVTGGGSGIGYYITEALVAEGMQVAILGRRQVVLDQAVERLGGTVFGIRCDIGNADEVRVAFDAVGTRLGRLDVLINNAGVFDIYRVADATDEELRSTVETNILGVLYCVRAAVPLMRKAGGGDIISLSSESVARPLPYLSVYAASKAALETLCRGLKSELRPDRIRVAVLRSGFVSVPERERTWDPDRARVFFEEAEKGGHLAEVGAGIDPRVTGAGVVSMLKQPRAASVDLLELRGC